MWSLLLFFSTQLLAIDCKVLLNEIGAPTDTTARFNRAEWPYHKPKALKTFGPEKPFDIRELTPGKRYLWVIDEAGNIRIAREFAAEHNAPSAYNPEGRNRIFHRDLVAKDGLIPIDPAQYVPNLDKARIGGEFRFQRDAQGNVKIEFNTKSAYTPAVGLVLPRVREDGQDRTGQKPLEAARDYFIELSQKAVPLSGKDFQLIPFHAKEHP